MPKTVDMQNIKIKNSSYQPNIKQLELSPPPPRFIGFIGIQDLQTFETSFLIRNKCQVHYKTTCF